MFYIIEILFILYPVISEEYPHLSNIVTQSSISSISVSVSRSIISFNYDNKSNSSLLILNMESNNNLAKPVKNGDKYSNPWSTWKMPSVWSGFKFALETDNSNIPKQDVLDKTLPIVVPDFNYTSDKLSLTWIGHSTAVIHLNGITILTDPIFSERASMSQFIGPSRYRRAAVTVDELPLINAVVISHNHYDHLDLNSVEALNKRFGSDLYWFVALGMSEWMKDVGCHNVIELDWWQHSSIPSFPDIQFILTPAQHWTRRGLSDECKALWGSWAVVGPKHKFYFAGDTGYCPVFKQIGQMFGPFDLAAIPIGAYEPRWFMSPQHVDPEEALLIHKDIKSKMSVGVHWGTFALAHEYYLEPPTKLKNILKEQQMDEKEFICISHGQTLTI